MREQEIAELRGDVDRAKKALAQRKADEDLQQQTERMQRALAVLEQRKRTEAQDARRRAAKAAWRKGMEERVARGGRVFFQSRRATKRAAAVAQFRELKASRAGSRAVEAAIERRERKKLSKERRRPIFRE